MPSIVSPNPCVGIFPCIHLHISTMLEYSREFLFRFPQFSLSAFLSFLVLDPVNLAPVLFPDSKLYFSNSDSALVSLHTLQCRDCQCSKTYRGLTSFVPSFSDWCPLLLCVLNRIISYVLSGFWLFHAGGPS